MFIAAQHAADYSRAVTQANRRTPPQSSPHTLIPCDEPTKFLEQFASAEGLRRSQCCSCPSAATLWIPLRDRPLWRGLIFCPEWLSHDDVGVRRCLPFPSSPPGPDCSHLLVADFGCVRARTDIPGSAPL